MAEVQVTHTFVSSKPDSPDPTLVSSNEWNAAHKAQGGSDGQVGMRSSGAASGEVWVHGPTVLRTQDAFTGSVGTTPAMASTVVILSSAAYVLLVPSVKVQLALGSDGICSVFRDGAPLVTGEIRADSTYVMPFPAVVAETGGSHTYHVLITGSSGLITSAQAILTVTILGRL